MNFWKSSRASEACDGAVMVVADATNINILKDITDKICGYDYKININSRTLLDAEAYIEYRKRIDPVYNNLYNLATGNEDGSESPKLNRFKIRNRKDIEEEQQNNDKLIELVLKDKRKITVEAKTTNSVYTFARIDGKIYEVRQSDHDKKHDSYASVKTLREMPDGVPLKVNSMTRFGMVSYSTVFRTTIKTPDGSKAIFLTSKLNELLSK